MTRYGKPSSHMIGAGLLLGAAALAGPSGAPAQGEAGRIPVDLELVLAVDVSQSMDANEHQLQRSGYAEAFRHEDVIDSITFGAANGLAVIYIEWGDAYEQNVIVDWTLIRTRDDALRFADALERTNVYPSRRTSITGALSYSADEIETNEYAGARRVIDISGDGPNNSGGAVADMRDAVTARNIIINGLPILLNDTLEWYDIPELDKYYEDCVIGGPGAFIAPVHSIEELAATIRGKLVLEIAGLRVRNDHGRIVPVQFFMEGEEEQRANCLIGEQMLNRGGGRFR